MRRCFFLSSVYEQIAQHYSRMTAAERRVADYFLQHKPNIQTTSITPIAESCNVSPATLTRFCRKLGCESFNEFRARLCAENTLPEQRSGNIISEVRSTDSIEEKGRKLLHIYTDALNATLELISETAITEAVNLLYRAKNVYCFGQGDSGSVAQDASTRFAPISAKFHWIADAHLQSNTAALLEEDDVVLYFSFSGATRELMEVGQLVQDTPGKLILVTRFPNAPGVRYCDVLLQCGVRESPQNRGSVAAKIAQLYVIDILFNEYSSRNLEQAIQNRKKTVNATRSNMYTENSRHFSESKKEINQEDLL